MRASFKRLLLAIYIDFLVYASVLYVPSWLVSEALEIDPSALTWAVFVAVEAGVWLAGRGSVGRWALGIGPRPDLLVEPGLTTRERWWTLLAGVLLVLEGSKNLVRWTEGLPIAPLLGPDLSHVVAAATISALGLLNVGAGLLVLRTSWVGAVLGAVIIVAETAGTLLHRDAFRQWAADNVVTRRALQGLPVRPDEIATMQMLTTDVMPGVMALGAVWLIAVAVRFKRLDAA